MRLFPLLFLVACAPNDAADVSSPSPQVPAPIVAPQIATDDLMDHLERLQEIADDNGGNRAVGQPGFAASVDYAESVFRKAGYDVQRSRFWFQGWAAGEPTIVETPDGSTSLQDGTDITAMAYSARADVTAPLSAVDLLLPPSDTITSTSGCESSDFSQFPPGNIALIQRGDCFFQQKVDNAVAAGAVGVLIFNEGQPGRRGLEAWQLNEDANTPIPVAAATFDVGESMANFLEQGAVTLRIRVDAGIVEMEAENVIVETPGGDPSNVLVVGGHLDSVPEGPGINDNGTGVAVVLELAKLVAEEPMPPKNKIRFALWGAEELGLHGSTAYVQNLDDDQLDTILANLNFDMMGSPNGSPMVYDGDGSDFGLPGPNGSDAIEEAFHDWFELESLDATTTVFDGRSDYFEFITNGIPAGGLFSGAEGIKEFSEAASFGGEAGEPRDACYHRSCDDIDNIDPVLFERLGNAASHAMWTLANQEADWAETRRMMEMAPLEVPIGGCNDGHPVRL